MDSATTVVAFRLVAGSFKTEWQVPATEVDAQEDLRSLISADPEEHRALESFPTVVAVTSLPSMVKNLSRVHRLITAI